MLPFQRWVISDTEKLSNSFKWKSWDWQWDLMGRKAWVPILICHNASKLVFRVSRTTENQREVSDPRDIGIEKEFWRYQNTLTFIFLRADPTGFPLTRIHIKNPRLGLCRTVSWAKDLHKKNSFHYNNADVFSLVQGLNAQAESGISRETELI